MIERTWVDMTGGGITLPLVLSSSRLKRRKILPVGTPLWKRLRVAIAFAKGARSINFETRRA